MSLVMTSHGPGNIEAIVVNGKKKWQNVKFEKECIVDVGNSIKIDGKIFYKAKKGDNFYLTRVVSGKD